MDRLDDLIRPPVRRVLCTYPILALENDSIAGHRNQNRMGTLERPASHTLALPRY
jgi:hypothetical protein